MLCEVKPDAVSVWTEPWWGPDRAWVWKEPWYGWSLSVDGPCEVRRCKRGAASKTEVKCYVFSASHKQMLMKWCYWILGSSGWNINALLCILSTMGVGERDRIISKHNFLDPTWSFSVFITMKTNTSNERWGWVQGAISFLVESDV